MRQALLTVSSMPSPTTSRHRLHFVVNAHIYASWRRQYIVLDREKWRVLGGDLVRYVHLHDIEFKNISAGPIK